MSKVVILFPWTGSSAFVGVFLQEQKAVKFLAYFYFAYTFDMSHDNQTDLSAQWTHHMRRGAYEEAWKVNDLELKLRAGKSCSNFPRNYQYIWDGTPLQGKRVLLRCYHGLGDTIQFIRYAPLIKAVAAKLIVMVQPPLIPLLKTVEGIDQLLPLPQYGGRSEAAFDVDAEIMELPHLFRTKLTTIPSEFPYLHVEPMLLPECDDSLISVGLVWKASDWDDRRSIPFSLLSPLADVQGVRFYILQSEASSVGWNQEFGIYPGDCSLHEYARYIRALDLLISVDSMPAHLAGALHVPVWNLLHAEADWRWMEDREDSPWYPGMRLFRQERSGEWKEVIARVAAELEKRSKSKRQV